MVVGSWRHGRAEKGAKIDTKWTKIDRFLPNHDPGESIKLFRWGNSVVMFVGDTDGLLAPSLDSQGGHLVET